MPNAFFEKAGEGLVAGELNWPEQDFRVMLVDRAIYQPDISSHQFLTDIPANARIAISPPLKNKTVSGFVLDCDDVTMLGVEGPLCKAAVIFQKNLLITRSRLFLLIEDAKWLPFLPNGGDLEIQWSNGPDKVCRF